ncbi:MAG: CRISPR-associated endonuclease Cas6 [Chitinophagales bacterium]
MTKLRYFCVTFNAQIQPWEIPLFRGAIIQKVGMEHEWYHNHDNNAPQKPAFHYRYPLIQYKTNHKKQPMILCLHESIEDIHAFFRQQDWSIELKGKPIKMSIEELNLQEFDLRVNPQSDTYQIQNWIALNQDNFREYHAIRSLTQKILYLESKLTGHILAFATGVDWKIEDRLQVEITELLGMRNANFKGQRMETFSLRFNCNAFLPNYIGLGKGSSMGFGVVKKRYKGVKESRYE